MKPPKTVEIGNRTYSLLFEGDPVSDGNKVYGFMSSVNCKIVLDKNMQPKRMAETLLHELLHCIYADYNYIGGKERKAEEFYVQVGGVGLTKLFRDNPKVLTWYLYLLSA